MKSQTDLFGSVVVPVPLEHDALGFLIKYARKMRGQSFSSEHVTLAAIDAGIVFQEMRSWGSVFTQAAREGYIRRSDVLFSRSMGNGSLSPGWTGV
jgi:hypothetical protein